MTARVLNKDEYFPFYELDEEVTGYKYRAAREYPAAFLERHDRVLAEFYSLQGELQALWSAAQADEVPV